MIFDSKQPISNIPMPQNTNCDLNSIGFQGWRLFVLNCPLHARHTVSWYKLERNYYKADQDDGSVIFFEHMKNGSYGTRYVPAEEAKFESAEEWQREFSRRLNYLLDDRLMSQKELSERTGISRSALSLYTVHKRMPSSYVVRQIANALDTTVSFLSDF